MKPSDLQLGLLEIFAVLVPGAMTAWLLWRLCGFEASHAWLLPEDPEARAVAFAMAALGLGQVLERAGAAVLDPIFTRHRTLPATLPDAERRRRERAQHGAAFHAILELRAATLGLQPPADPAPGSAMPTPGWAAWVLRGRDEALAPADRLAGAPPVNAYQFACGVLRAVAPASAAEIDRLQALSKFFRTLSAGLVVVAICVLPGGAPALRGPLAMMVLLGLAALSVAGYWALRVKAIEAAYTHALLALALPPAAKP